MNIITTYSQGGVVRTYRLLKCFEASFSPWVQSGLVDLWQHQVMHRRCLACDSQEGKGDGVMLCYVVVFYCMMCSGMLCRVMSLNVVLSYHHIILQFFAILQHYQLNNLLYHTSNQLLYDHPVGKFNSVSKNT